ncbi:NupC/NupG family nucleoside CNT transporter, partial [Bacillus thuringiensis]|nr:NupC/NupG family nucleoside CNT transporter [Bacillus thuringiensis]
MKFITFFVGLIIVFLLAYIASNNKKHIKFKPIFIMLIIQLILTYLLLNTEIGLIL